MELIFASNNKNKIVEIQKIVPDYIHIISLAQAEIAESLPEPYDSFTENAFSKANYIYQKTGKNCFSEDSGIVVPSLHGEPGVFSARYAGEPANDMANNDKLLNNLKDKTDRSAYYQATICLILNKEAVYFEGRCDGKIALEPRGNAGFGYDPLFIPENYTSTFAELSLEEKLAISHRSIAFNKLATYLKQISR